MSIAEMTKRGNSIAKCLHLKRDPEHADRWITDWGTKTGLGLYLTLSRQLVEN